MYLYITIFAISMLLMIYGLYSKRRKNIIMNKLARYLYEGNFVDFDKIIEKNETRLFVPHINLIYMKLNKEFFSGNTEETKRLIIELLNCKSNKDQKLIMFSKAFTYSISIKEYVLSEQLYKELKQLDTFNDIGIDTSYDTFVLNGYKYLEQTLNTVEELSKEEKPYFYMLISKMYENKKDLTSSAKYKELAKKH